MKRFYSILSNAIFAINLLLVFFWLFRGQVVVPEWLQVAGRMHPMLLHLPIGLLLLPVLLPAIRKHLPEAAYHQIHLFVLALGSGTAALAALMGFLLSREAGYESELVGQHGLAGIGLSWMAYGLFVWLKHRKNIGRLFQLGLFSTALVLVLAGHLGAGITHGEDYVLAPVRADEPAVTGDTPAYEALIVPLLQQKCFSCHNEQKTKGGLLMTDPGKFRKGGDTGKAFVAGDPERSLLIERLELPLEAEEHMPPEGKPQLSEAEIRLLKDWITDGAHTDLAIKALAAGSPLKEAAEQVLAAAAADEEKAYDFGPASENLIRELNIPFRTVKPLSSGSPALRAGIFIRETYDPQFLEDLLAVKEQLVDLKLDHLPVQDEELSVVAQFRNLEKLNLNNTDISGKSLQPLTALKQLRRLSLSGTPIDTGIAGMLRQLPALEELYVWNTALDTAAIKILQGSFPGLHIHSGYLPEAEELLPLSPPVVKIKENLEGKSEIHFKHNFPGAVIRYTVDGSEPDSLSSLVYEGPIQLPRFALVQARAFREGWIGSKVTKTTFFPPSIPIREAQLLTTPHPKHSGTGADGLIDGDKGLVGSFRSPYWLGFREGHLEALFFPEDASIPIDRVTISYLLNIGSYIMPPATVEVWGGKDADHLQLLHRMQPPLPKKYLPNEIVGLDIPIPASTFRCYKIVARPVTSLPAWHRGKGDRAWIFLDEVYFYNDAPSALVPEAIGSRR